MKLNNWFSKIRKVMSPSIITVASDDDPSEIATYTKKNYPKPVMWLVILLSFPAIILNISNQF